jgi:hypothetical protein
LSRFILPTEEKTMTNDAVVHFELEKGQCEGRLTYHPWSTRTLKVKVSAGTDMPKLRIRPKGVLPRLKPERPGKDLVCAHADTGEAFVISWGGGHEAGPCARAKDFLSAFETCAPLKKEDTSFIFFNARHVGPDCPETATVTLEARECRGMGCDKVGREVASLKVTLQKPSGTPATDEIMRVVPADQKGRWVVSSGGYLPRYDSRWWPGADVAYEPSEPVPLTIRLEERQLLVKWADKDEAIALIADSTKPPSILLTPDAPVFELFAFDEGSAALRVWFFWLDKNMGGGGGFIGRHEVPDAERFDMIINRRVGRVLLACSDLHWRETWGEVIWGKPLLATLGMTQETKSKLAREKWSGAWNGLWDRVGRLLNGGQMDAETSYNPLDETIRPRVKELALKPKARGTEAHIPMLHNIDQEEEDAEWMSSSDVRLG